MPPRLQDPRSFLSGRTTRVMGANRYRPPRPSALAPLFVEDFAGNYQLAPDFNPAKYTGGTNPAGWTDQHLGHYDGPDESPYTTDNFALIAAPGRPGFWCLQVTVGPNDYVLQTDQSVGKERAQLLRTPRAAELALGPEFWYSASYNFPTNYNYDSVPPPANASELFQIIHQFHDSGLGEGHQPSIATHYEQTGSGGASSLTLRYGLEPDFQVGNVPISRGVWNQLIFHVRWSKGSDGFVEAYLNGTYLVTFYGPNVFPEEVGNLIGYHSLGMYRGHGSAPEQAQTNTFYLGWVRIALTRESLWLPDFS